MDDTLTAKQAAKRTADSREYLARYELPLPLVLAHIENMAEQGQSLWQHAMLLPVDLAETAYAKTLTKKLKELGFTVEWRPMKVPAHLSCNTTGVEMTVRLLTVRWHLAVSEKGANPA